MYTWACTNRLVQTQCSMVILLVALRNNIIVPHEFVRHLCWYNSYNSISHKLYERSTIGHPTRVTIELSIFDQLPFVQRFHPSILTIQVRHHMQLAISRVNMSLSSWRYSTKRKELIWHFNLKLRPITKWKLSSRPILYMNKAWEPHTLLLTTIMTSWQPRLTYISWEKRSVILLVQASQSDANANSRNHTKSTMLMNQSKIDHNFYK